MDAIDQEVGLLSSNSSIRSSTVVCRDLNFGGGEFCSLAGCTCLPSVETSSFLDGSATELLVSGSINYAVHDFRGYFVGMLGRPF